MNATPEPAARETSYGPPPRLTVGELRAMDAPDGSGLLVPKLRTAAIAEILATIAVALVAAWLGSDAEELSAETVAAVTGVVVLVIGKIAGYAQRGLA